MPDLLATDGLTYALGFTAAVVFLLHTYLAPQSLVHPILLGRQSDVERVRQKGESAVYRNYGTGIMGRLPLSPENSIQKVWDLVKADFTGSRYLWSTKATNGELKSRISALASGFVRVAGLRPKESNVLLLTDGLPFLLADLALASQAITSFTVSSLALLSDVIEKHPVNAIIVDVGLAHEVLELIMDNQESQHYTFILVGEGDVPKALQKVQVKVLWLSDLERQGAKEESLETATVESDDVFSIAFYPGPSNELKATQITHRNITAGVAATRALFPLNGAITPADSIFSSFSLSTPYGRAIAYTALYEGANFTTSLPTPEGFEKGPDEEVFRIAAIQPTPTILFATYIQLCGMIFPINTKAKDSWLFPLAWRQKLSHVQNGFLSNDSIWDRWVYAGPRKAVLQSMADTLRSVVLSGGILHADMLDKLRVSLAVPFVNVYSHPLVAGPVFFSHPLDLQGFPLSAVEKQGDFARIASVGPPSINVEVKLVNVNDDAIEGGADPIGEVAVRGPSVTLPIDGTSKPYNWVLTGDRGLAQSNGTFKVLPAKYNKDT